ncbi:MAG: DUF1841 family protein [Betaproteobacteria bacterium]|nr:DUF1841 family protein [Betaproteobacteria bacterium]
MFNPSREEVRDFLFEAWRKFRTQEPLAGLEAAAAAVIAAHPEYHAMLADRAEFLERHRDRDYPPEFGETNPFLHLSMHLSIREQVAIDQPPGVRGAHAGLTHALGDPLSAEHEMMDGLAEMLWHAQRHGTAPDAQRYLEVLARKLAALGGKPP